MKRILITGICLILVNTFIIAQTNWSQKTSMFNYGRHVAVSFTIGNKAYVGLGDIPNLTRISDFWEYDPSKNVWTRKADFPGGGRYAASSFAVNGKGYVCLGADASGVCRNDLWEYNPSTNIWTQKSEFPGIPRYGASSFVIGNFAYVGTGSYGSSNNYLYDFWMYDPSSNSWSQKTNFPGYNRCHASAFSIGTYGFLGTGLYNDFTPTQDFWKYSPSTDSWTRCSDFPEQPRMGMLNFVISNEAYVGFGFDQVKDYNDMFKYDPISDLWTSVQGDTNIVARRGSVGFSIDQIGYFCTGETFIGLMPDLWAFNPDVSAGTIEQTVNNIKYSIAPNPAQEKIVIESSELLSNATVSIVNISGQELLKSRLSKETESVDIKGLVLGTYFAVISNHGNIVKLKFIKD